MSQPQNKRRKVDVTDKWKLLPAEVQNELHRFSMEVETVREDVQDPIGGSCTRYRYRPTSKAVLANNGFLVRETIGEGSYSKVKVANCAHERYPKNVAVKIIDKSLAPKDYQQKFLPRELRHWPNLNHKHLVRLFRTIYDEKKVFMILEYAPGGDALRFIQKHGSVGEQVARQWGYQITSAIQYMHDRDITHRDLKLENLLLDRDNNIKICDFGFIKAESSVDLSRTFCGSKSYAAPEILEGRPYDPKASDVWAFGVILYIFVTGRMPFDEKKGTKSILAEQNHLEFKWGGKELTCECKSLIMWMFTWKYKMRPTIYDILNHNWLNSGTLLSAITFSHQTSEPLGVMASEDEPTTSSRAITSTKAISSVPVSHQCTSPYAQTYRQRTSTQRTCTRRKTRQREENFSAKCLFGYGKGVSDGHSGHDPNLVDYADEPTGGRPLSGTRLDQNMTDNHIELTRDDSSTSTNTSGSFGRRKTSASTRVENNNCSKPNALLKFLLSPLKKDKV